MSKIYEKWRFLRFCYPGSDRARRADHLWCGHLSRERLHSILWRFSVFDTHPFTVNLRDRVFIKTLAFWWKGEGVGGFWSLLSQRKLKFFEKKSVANFEKVSPITPITNKKSPMANNKSPLTNKKSPMSSNKSPMTNKKSPMSNKKSPMTNNKSQMTNNKSPMTNNKSPMTTNAPKLQTSRKEVK